MPVKAPNIIIPTGYESQQRAAERKRKIAQALMQQGMGMQNQHMQSWLQPVSAAFQAWAGNRLDKKADKMNDEIDSNVRKDYGDALERFNNATADPNTDPMTVVREFGANPYLADRVKMYAEAAGAGLKEKENIVKAGNTYDKVGNLYGKPLPNDPNAAVNVGPNGEWMPNMARIVAAGASQGLVDPNDAAQYRGVDPMSQPQGMPAQPAQPAMPQGGVNLLDQLSPEDKAIMTQMLEKYAGKGASLQGVVPNGAPTGPAPKPPIPPQHIQMLKANPNLAAFFDQTYGPGTAEEVLRGQ